MFVASKQYPVGSAQGFTLIELMVTIMVATIVVMYGVPGLQKMIERDRLTARTNQLVHSLFLARSEAVKLNQPVSVCGMGAGTGDDAGIWKNGWAVETGDNCSGTQTIESIGPGKSGSQVTTSINKITFLGDGTVDGSTQAAFVLIDASYKPDSNHRRVVELTLGGSVHSCKPVVGRDDCELQE